MEDIKKVFTIGHSTHSIERFIDLLKMYGISALADVRSTPYSKINPQFNRECLQKDLKKNNIFYVFMGKELGARSDDPNCYECGKVRYSRLANTKDFKNGINRILKGVKDYTIALMCSEKDPLTCHRTILVSRELINVGISVVHIHGDGHLESHDEILHRLIKAVGLQEDDLFTSKEQMIGEAYLLQEEKIAYVDKEKVSTFSKRPSDENLYNRVYEKVS